MGKGASGYLLRGDAVSDRGIVLYLVNFRNKGYYKTNLNTDERIDRVIRPQRTTTNGHADHNLDSDDEDEEEAADDAISGRSKELEKGYCGCVEPFLVLGVRVG